MNYYESEFSKVKPELTPYSPFVKIFANGNGEDTKYITIHEQSASELIFWLANNFLNDESLEKSVSRLKSLAGERTLG
jgi:hypothetical protein